MNVNKPMKILLVSAEVYPFAAVGGLSQVVYYLAKALIKKGHDVRIMMPKYAIIDEGKFKMKKIVNGLKISSGNQGRTLICNVKQYNPKEKYEPTVYFLENMEYYEKRANVYGYIDDPIRWGLLNKGVLEFLKVHPKWKPEIIHTNDWQTGHIPYFLKNEYKDDAYLRNISSIFAIHNLYYQGSSFDHRFQTENEQDNGKDLVDDLFSDKFLNLNFMKRGIMYADIVTTVSPTYAKEILKPEYGEKLDSLLRDMRGKVYGVLNGIDFDEFNPKTDKLIPQNFDKHSLHLRSANKEELQREFNLEEDLSVPIITMVGRLEEQKGLDLVLEVIKHLLDELKVQFVILGGGQPKYMTFFQDLQNKYPRQVGTYLKPNFALPRHLFSGGDIFLMPSNFEPCGVTQMEAMRYGSVPVVHKVGGLNDTVKDFKPETMQGNGFVFSKPDSMAMYTAIIRALETYKHKEVWNKLIQNCMESDFSWSSSAKKYSDLYEKALAVKSAEKKKLPVVYREVLG